MAYPQRRPLPNPPVSIPYSSPISSDMYSRTTPYFSSPYPPYAPRQPHPYDSYDEPTTTLPGGTLLHKGFYDLLAMIPTPSPSRFLWGSPVPDPVIAGPRYEDQPPRTNVRNNVPPPALSSPGNPPALRKGRRISKDMVSKPTGFVYVYE
jgi:protein-serine/threonine kinase